MNMHIADDVAAIARIPAVQRILEAVAHLTGMRFAAVARVTETTWTACAVRDAIDFGLAPGGELVLESTICNEIRQHHTPVVFGQASAHPVFSTHHTPRQYGIESYISIPIFRRDGAFFGTLCAIDPEPAPLDDPNIVRTLELFAELISEQMESEARLVLSQDALQDARHVVKLREQFVTVLGRDLRDPLTVIRTYAHLLADEPLGAEWVEYVDDMNRSCERMSDLLDKLLDFARGRLGEGIPVRLVDVDDLGNVLSDVVESLRAAHPERVIESDIQVTGAVMCDPDRIAQLARQVLLNALTHGDASGPVRVLARKEDGRLSLAIENRGPPIDDAMRSQLFEPFLREAPNPAGGRLALGLYLSGQIAQAHGGRLVLESSDGRGTRFVFGMPLDAADETLAL